MKLNRLGPILGIAFFVFIAISISTGNTPQSNASGLKVIHYYTHHRDRLYVSIATDVLGAIAGMFFFSYLYAWLRRIDSSWIPTTLLLSSAIFLAGGLLAGSSEFMVVDRIKHISPDVAQALNIAGNDLWELVVTGGVGALTLAIGISMRISRTHKWFAITAIVIGIISIVLFFAPLGFFLFGLWVLVFSIIRLRDKEVALVAEVIAR